jgi:prevent-host-death family protein
MYMTRTVSVRDLRQHLGPCLKQVAAGNQLVVQNRGRPVARIIPEPAADEAGDDPHPLRGSVRHVGRDFDAPVPGLWKALKG